MFREMMDLSSVDAVLNLLNVKIEPKPVEEKPAEVVDEQAPVEVKKDETK